MALLAMVTLHCVTAIADWMRRGDVFEEYGRRERRRSKRGTNVGVRNVGVRHPGAVGTAFVGKCLCAREDLRLKSQQ